MTFPDSSPPSTQVWLITGAGGGLGASLVRAALNRGHRVVATARRGESLESLRSEHNVLPLAFDVVRDDPAGLIDQALRWASRMDVLVNNAGCGLLAPLEFTHDDDLAACMEVNFLGPFRMMRAAAPVFRAQRSGCVINISAAAAIANYPGFSGYGAAKAALEAASESFRMEMAPYGVSVTLVEPGPFRTGFIGNLNRPGIPDAYGETVGKFDSMLARIDGRQPGLPDKAAESILGMVAVGRAPLRVPLGAYAVRKVRETAAARLRELEACIDICEQC